VTKKQSSFLKWRFNGEKTKVNKSTFDIFSFPSLALSGKNRKIFSLRFQTNGIYVHTYMHTYIQTLAGTADTLKIIRKLAENNAGVIYFLRFSQILGGIFLKS
jgi:hypothetical protein